MFQLNTQPREKLDESDDGSVDLHSVFLTVQGEGPHAGRPAVFVRLAGCNLQCPGCDTDYTSRRQQRMAVADVVATVRLASAHHPVDLIVLTGGEPFRQNCGPLVRQLLIDGFQVQVETNGTYTPKDFPFWHEDVDVVCSPKSGFVRGELLEKCSHALTFKYVLQAGQVHPDDGLPLSVLGNGVVVTRPPSWLPRKKIYLQPFDEQDPAKMDANLQACLKSSQQFGYRIGVQLHKLLRIA